MCIKFDFVDWVVIFDKNLPFDRKIEYMSNVLLIPNLDWEMKNRVINSQKMLFHKQFVIIKGAAWKKNNSITNT